MQYGLTLEGYRDLLEAQGGGCAICGRPAQGRFRWLSVDHDHETGGVRGLLCQACNVLVGFAESPKLRDALSYLGTV